MQISSSALYNNARQAMSSLTDQANTLETQISTNKKLTSAADDVVAYQRLATIKRDTADGTADASNVSMASSLLQQSDSTLSSITTEIQKAQQLATQANTGVMSDSDKKAIATQIQSVLDSLVSLANTKDSRGGPLFGGTSGDTAVSLNSDGSGSFPTTNPASIPIGNGDSVTPTASAKDVFGNITGTSGPTTDLFKVLGDVISALNAGGDTTTAVSNAVNDLQTAGTQVSSVQASLGARAARVDLVQQGQTTAATDRETTRTALEDTDITDAITKLQQTMTVLQATQASFTKLSSLSLFNYLN